MAISGKVTLDLNRRTVGRLGLLWNRMTPTRGAGVVSGLIATTSRHGAVAVSVSRAQLSIKMGEQELPIYRSEAYARCLWKAGVTEIEIDSGMSQDRVGAILDVLISRKINGISSFGLQPVSPNGKLLYHSVPITWQGLFGEIAPPYSNLTLDVCLEDLKLYSKLIGSIGGIIAGGILGYHYSPDILSISSHGTLRTLASFAGMVLGGGTSTGVLFLFTTLVGGSIRRIYHVLHFASDLREIRSLYNSEHQIDYDRLDDVFERIYDQKTVEQYVRGVASISDLSKLARSKFPVIVEMIASNPKTSVEDLRKIQFMDDKRIIIALLNNPNTPKDVIMKCFKDDSFHLVYQGHAHDKGAAETPSNYAYERIKDALTIEELLALRSGHNAIFFIDKIINHPITPRQVILEEAIGGHNITIRLAAVKKLGIDISSEEIEKILSSLTPPPPNIDRFPDDVSSMFELLSPHQNISRASLIKLIKMGKIIRTGKNISLSVYKQLEPTLTTEELVDICRARIEDIERETSLYVVGEGLRIEYILDAVVKHPNMPRSLLVDLACKGYLPAFFCIRESLPDEEIEALMSSIRINQYRGLVLELQKINRVYEQYKAWFIANDLLSQQYSLFYRYIVDEPAVVEEYEEWGGGTGHYASSPEKYHYELKSSEEIQEARACLEGYPQELQNAIICEIRRSAPEIANLF